MKIVENWITLRHFAVLYCCFFNETKFDYYMYHTHIIFFLLRNRMLCFKNKCIITLCISGDELTISTSFKNGNVLFSWGNLQKTFYDVRINGQWIQVNESKYTVKDALLYDNININVREYEKRSPKDHTFTYNGK